MVISKVKIVKCTSKYKECWYANRIGEIFEVVKDTYKYREGEKYLVVEDLEKDTTRCIDDQDVILIYN